MNLWFIHYRGAIANKPDFIIWLNLPQERYMAGAESCRIFVVISAVRLEIQENSLHSYSALIEYFVYYTVIGRQILSQII